MLEALMNPGAMTQDQWMIVAILVFIVIGIFYFLYRTYVIIRESATKKYKPNIGLSRMQDKAGTDSSATGNEADKDS